MEKENKGKSKFWKGVLAGSLVTALAGFGIVGVATGISVIGRTVIENQAQNTTAEGSGSDAVRTQVIFFLTWAKMANFVSDYK